MGLMCIAAILVSKMIEATLPECLTVGNDPDTADPLDNRGAEYVICPADDSVVDETHQIVTTPAWIIATRIGKVSPGIEKRLQHIVVMTDAQA